eukprot:Skav235570  [mRNA]  locus=scaffold612:26529:32038:+ [translate_table: standard]
MGRKVARTPATGPDVKARGLDSASVPAPVVEGLLGKEGSFRVADVGVSTEDAYASLYTESFVRDGAALQYFDAEFTRYANLLSPHLERAKIEVSARSSSLLHEASKPKGDGPALTEEADLRDFYKSGGPSKPKPKAAEHLVQMPCTIVSRPWAACDTKRCCGTVLGTAAVRTAAVLGL